jgi:hypothetical protein
VGAIERVHITEVYAVKNVSHFPVPRADVTNQFLPGREVLNYSRLFDSLVVTLCGGNSTIPSSLRTGTVSSLGRS